MATKTASEFTTQAGDIFLASTVPGLARTQAQTEKQFFQQMFGKEAQKNPNLLFTDPTLQKELAPFQRYTQEYNPRRAAPRAAGTFRPSGA